MTRTLPSFSKIIPIALTFTLALGALAGCTSGSNGSGGDTGVAADSASSGSSTVIKEGAIAPDFEFETTDGRTAKLSDYKGQVVLLNFWATWCGYCMREMPDLGQINDTYSDVTVLAINRGDAAGKAVAKADELGYDFVWGLDQDGAIEALYPSNGIPYSVVIDKDGVVSAVFNGSAEDMYGYFEQAVVKAGA